MGSSSGHGSADSALPRRLGNYILHEFVAKGRYGSIYLATTQNITGAGSLLVIKQLHRRLVRDEAFAKRVIGVARTAIPMLHTNVVRLFEVNRDEHQHQLYLVMEHIPGRTVRSFLSEHI